MSNVGQHHAGGVCLNLKNSKNSTYEVNEHCNILPFTLASIHSSKCQTCSCEACGAQKSSQTWGVFVCDYCYFVWPKWLVFLVLDVQVPDSKAPAVFCHCFLSIHQASTAKNIPN